jgi:hypothetical protein
MYILVLTPAPYAIREGEAPSEPSFRLPLGARGSHGGSPSQNRSPTIVAVEIPHVEAAKR